RERLEARPERGLAVGIRELLADLLQFAEFVRFGLTMQLGRAEEMLERRVERPQDPRDAHQGAGSDQEHECGKSADDGEGRHDSTCRWRAVPWWTSPRSPKRRHGDGFIAWRRRSRSVGPTRSSAPSG